LRVLFVSLLIIILDQVSKILVKGLSVPSLNINIQGMHYQQSIDLIGDFFKITYIENPGMAFGIQIGGKLFLSLFTIAATLLIVYFIYKNRKEPLYLRLALALILGGAVGNLIDRIFYGVIYGYAPLFYGNVVDFFHIDTPNFVIFGKPFYSWPIFNIADIAVSLGFVMILFGYRKISKPKETPEQELIKTEETENTFTTEINSPLEPPPMERNDNTQLSA
jgi:signal peptidase II